MTITTAELFELAAQPIGNRDLQREADDVVRRGIKPSDELKATIKRVSKRWLPRGKKSPVSVEAKAADAEARARNYDLEDAVALAGGNRGHMGR